MIDISAYFLTISGMATLAMLVTAWINAKIKGEAIILGFSTRQLTSWAVCIGLAFLGQIKGLGLFAETTTGWTIVNGIAVGLFANGIFSLEFIQSLLIFLKLKQPK